MKHKVKSISIKVPKEITLPDGLYTGTWGGYTISLRYADKEYELKTEEGVRGIGIPVVIEVKDGEVLKQYPLVAYLNEESTEAFGLKIYGTPIQPWFHDWAFNRMRGEDIQQHWDKIPEDTDVLVVHGPPYMILDHLHPQYQRYNENPNVGCENLREKIFDIKPKLVVFGHIHEGYGSREIDGITFVNASCLNENYKPMNPPQFVEIEI